MGLNKPLWAFLRLKNMRPLFKGATFKKLKTKIPKIGFKNAQAAFKIENSAPYFRGDL